MKCKNCAKKVIKMKENPEAIAIGICTDCFYKPFPITSIARADLLEGFSKKQIASLEDGDMTEIASDMAEAYCDNGFWIDLPIITDKVLKDYAKA